MNVLFVGDIVGKGGRRAVCASVPELRREYGCSFCVANGENMVGGAGYSRESIEELRQSGVDVFTGGDHMWDRHEFADEIKHLPYVLRPANVNPVQPGVGYAIYSLPGDETVGVISLLGRVFMNTLSDCPFQTVERILPEVRKRTPCIIVDMHAEATSEKTAMARFLDGRVSAVLGTHTHVPTADQTIFPGGTAFQCDVGMVGARDSILGRAVEPVLHRFVTGMHARFTVVEKGIRLHGTVVRIGENGRATSIERVVRDRD